MKQYILPVVALAVLAGCGSDKESVTINDSVDTIGGVGTQMVDKADQAMDNIEDSAKEMAEETVDAAKEMAENAGEKAMEKTYTLADVAQHNTRADCWTVIDGQVADVTNFFGTHPGGDDALAKACGIDATEMFKQVEKHDPNAYAALKKMTIGSLTK